jgi:hypothetical protein
MFFVVMDAVLLVEVLVWVGLEFSGLFAAMEVAPS